VQNEQSRCCSGRPLASRINRRQLLQRSAAAGLAAPLVARGITVAAQDAAKGGSLSIVFVGEEPKLIDAQIDPFDPAALTCTWVADTLVSIDAEGNYIPSLATEWTTSEDGLTWTFTLRSDVTFHDGTPFNAAAAKANFDRILDPASASAQAAATLGPVVSTTAVDDVTFEVVHSAPWVPFLDSISKGFIPMWSPTALEEYGLDQFSLHLVGTGPFRAKEIRPAEQYVFERNPDYAWGPAHTQNTGAPYLEEITVRWILENTTAIAALQAGEANVVIGYPAEALTEIEGGDYQIVSAELTGSPTLYVMNTAKAPLDDLTVRKALQHAINQDEIVEVLWNGQAIATEGVMYPASPCYWAEAESLYPHDPDAAKTLLTEAGWTMGSDGVMEKDGTKLQVTIVNAFVEDLGTIVQSQLADIGVEATIELVTGPIQLERAASGDFNLIFQHFAYTDPGVLNILYNSANNKPGGWSWTRYQDPTLDDLLNRSTTTLDEVQRCELLTQAQQIVAEQALVLPLYGRYYVFVMAPEVKDFVVGPRPRMDAWLTDAYVEG
jgi:peptide/nickel transport system substrate-binding protein